MAKRKSQEADIPEAGPSKAAKLTAAEEAAVLPEKGTRQRSKEKVLILTTRGISYRQVPPPRLGSTVRIVAKDACCAFFVCDGERV